MDCHFGTLHFDFECFILQHHPRFFWNSLSCSGRKTDKLPIFTAYHKTSNKYSPFSFSPPLAAGCGSVSKMPIFKASGVDKRPFPFYTFIYQITGGGKRGVSSPAGRYGHDDGQHSPASDPLLHPPSDWQPFPAAVQHGRFHRGGLHASASARC